MSEPTLQTAVNTLAQAIAEGRELDSILRDKLHPLINRHAVSEREAKLKAAQEEAAKAGMPCLPEALDCMRTIEMDVRSQNEFKKIILGELAL